MENFQLCFIELLLKGMQAREARLNRPALGRYTMSRDTFESYLYEECCYWIEQQTKEAADMDIEVQPSLVVNTSAGTSAGLQAVVQAVMVR